jgi:hypothetical protein
VIRAIAFALVAPLLAACASGVPVIAIAPLGPTVEVDPHFYAPPRPYWGRDRYGAICSWPAMSRCPVERWPKTPGKW